MVAAYSQRLGKISPQQFQSALDRFGLGDFIRATPLPFGLFGQNVFITSTQGEFVLRGVPHYSWQFPTEQFFVEQLYHRTRVPVPYPYLVEPTTDIFGWSFVIMPRLPGVSLADEQVLADLPVADRLDIARAIACTLAEVHSLTWENSGKYDPETRRVRPFDQGYVSWIVAGIREKLTSARGHNLHTTAADRDWLEAIIAAAADMFIEPDKPCVVLGDYGEHNVIVQNTASGWQVSGVFDLMTAHFGDGNADLCQPVGGYLKSNSGLANAFVLEYLRHRPARTGFVERQQIYTLGLYASMWEYWQRVQDGPPDSPNACFQQWAGPAVDFWAGRFGIT